MKYSKNFERDWKFYTGNLDVFNFAGRPAPDIIVAPGAGLDAKECFYIYDSTGRLEPCVDPELLHQVIICKASVNLHIKLWVQGIAHSTLGLPELREYLASLDAPMWIMRGIAGQIRQARK